MKALVIALATLGLTIGAQAQQKKTGGQKKASMHDQFTGQGYGVAGCGLGSVVFGPKPGMIQVIAATLNGTAGSQTFGISTGTSNCEMSESSMAAATFIEVNREVVSKDAARGEGESLENLASIFQCSDFGLFKSKMKQNYGKVFNPELNSYDSSRAIVETIQTDVALAKSCGQIG